MLCVTFLEGGDVVTGDSGGNLYVWGKGQCHPTVWSPTQSSLTPFGCAFLPQTLLECMMCVRAC